MEILNKKLLEELASVTEGPCMSLYMPVHRNHPDNQSDPIKYNNLLKLLEESLLSKYTPMEVKVHLVPFEKLSTNDSVWNHTADGLAVFSSSGLFKVVTLPVTFDDVTLVADNFYTKPLRKYMQSIDRYHVLGISLHDVQLYEGYRHSLMVMDLPEGFPKTIEEALGDELTEKHSTVTSHGGTGGESSSLHHGHGGKKDEIDADAERFFRVIATKVHEQISKPTGLPIMLAALAEHHGLFQQVNNNPFLLPNGIQYNYKGIDNDKLTEAAWEVMEPAYLMKLKDLGEKYNQAEADYIGSDHLKDVAAAAAAGRVGTLLLEEDRLIGGKVTDKATGDIELSEMENPEVGDLLDEIGELVTGMGGDVLIIPQHKMPTQTGLAAIYRY